MVYGAIDLHSRFSQIRIVDADGEVRARAARADHARAAGARRSPSSAPMRILVEASTESEWVAQALEAAGHEVDRRRSELRADVWRRCAAAHQDR